jgi:hypothetical protein
LGIGPEGFKGRKLSRLASRNQLAAESHRRS